MASAPLAGRPPFATDDDDSIFTTQPLNTRRAAPPKPDNPNNRSSAYDVYDDYLPDNKTGKNPFNTPPTTPASHLRAPKETSPADPSNRQSGAGGIGMGLLNMDYSDSEDDDDDMPPPPKKQPAAAAAAAAPAPSISPSKNAALLAAIGNIDDPHTSSKPKPPPPAANLSINPTPPGLSAVPVNTTGNSRSPPPIAAPRPGYAAPVPATFGQNPFEGGGGIPAPKPIGGVPTPVQPVQIPPAAYNPRDGPHSPLLSLSPAPLQAPATPIMPVFALPRKATADKEGGVKFEVGKDPLPRNKSIMRGQSEDPLLPRRGEKGDDFWRRFSMVAREDSSKSGKKESVWLRKTRNGTTGFARWVWVVGLILLLAIVGSIALGVVLSMGKEEAPEAPSIIAGNTSKVAGPDATGVVVGGGGGAAGARPAGDATGPTTSRPVLHVTPTHTIRGLPEETGLFEVVVPTSTTPVPKVLGSVEGLVSSKQRRNSSVEVRGRMRRGHRVRRWD